MKRIPLEGQTRGNFLIEEYLGHETYRCRCKDCGAVFTVKANKLHEGRATRCPRCIDDSLKRLLSGPTCRSKTGVRGVVERPWGYEVYATYHRERHYLGSYRSLAEAEAARRAFIDSLPASQG